MILEELTDSDSISLDMILNFVHKSCHSLWAWEVNILWFISWLGTSEVFIDDIVENIAVLQEWQVLNITIFVSIDFGNRSILGIWDIYLKKGQNLLELLWRNLEMVMTIMILEEGLSVKSLPLNQIPHYLSHRFSIGQIFSSWTISSIHGLGSGIIQNNINWLLKIFLGENFINFVTEIFPEEEFSSLWSLKVLNQSIELDTW